MESISYFMNSKTSEIDKIEKNLNLELYYKKWIQDIPIDAGAYEASLKNLIDCIVFGAFYLEATINKTCMYILEDFSNGIDKELWKFVDKSKTNEKFEFIQNSIMKFESSENRKVDLKLLNSIFKLRNKLVHFKGEKKELRQGIENSGEYDLINNLKSKSIQERKKDILSLEEKIENSIFEYYRQSNS